MSTICDSCKEPVIPDEGCARIMISDPLPDFRSIPVDGATFRRSPVLDLCARCLVKLIEALSLPSDAFIPRSQPTEPCASTGALTEEDLIELGLEAGNRDGEVGGGQNEPREKRSIASDPARDGREVRVDLTALVNECSRAIVERPRDGSPPMVAVSADVVRALSEFALRLSCGIAQARSPDEVMSWRRFAADGPIVGGDGAADAWGSVVHPIHVSAVRG